MYGNTSGLIMGEAKRRKNLGIPPREKTEDIKLPQLDKKAIQQKVRTTLYKYPIIPCLLYTSPSPRDLSTSRMPSSA